LGDFLEFGEVRKLGEIWEINEKVGDVFFNEKAGVSLRIQAIDNGCGVL